jgi:hypothetical protein
MQLGLTTIQRNRGPWLVEWFAFHYLVGFRKFYFYAHMCTDDTAQILGKLAGKFDITPFEISAAQDGVQLAAYQHACDNYINAVDWMCFLDGDEFLYPTTSDTMQAALQPYMGPEVSALGVYNRNFGSSHHQQEPAGLITENYTWRANDDFMAQRRVKSLVKGHQKVAATNIGNLFATPLGTVDELMRPVTWGYMPDYTPSYARFCFNHYVCQSRDYFLKFKKHSGHADASTAAVREEEWWDNFNTNQVQDTSLSRFAGPLRAMVAQLNSELGITQVINP